MLAQRVGAFNQQSIILAKLYWQNGRSRNLIPSGANGLLEFLFPVYGDSPRLRGFALQNQPLNTARGS
jgi:hypothetical protein